MTFGKRLAEAVRKKGNPVCVGIDPRWEQLPEKLTSGKSSWEEMSEGYLQFSKGIIDVVSDLVPVIKPQSAFFEELGPAGVRVLGEITQYATAKGLLVIMDGKRNDIGSTATAYANAYLGRKSPFGSDALTVSPFLGADSLDPFVSRCKETDSGIFVLVKTSNAGSGFMQDLTVDGLTISDRVADYVQNHSLQTLDEESGYGAIGCVVGATYPDQITQMRNRMPNCWFLIPGYGAQGGKAEDVRRALDSSGLGAIVNSSRGIIFAYENPRFASASSWQHAVELSTREMISQLSK